MPQANFFLPTRSLYTTPLQVKAAIKASDNALGQVLAGVQDDLILYFCEDASQKVDEFCAPRVFYPYLKNSIYDWPGTSFELPLRDDLLRLDNLVNGDGNVIPPTVVISGSTLTTYFQYPPDLLPKYKVVLNIASGRVFLFVGTPQQAIQVQGMFGYPANEVQKLWYTASGATVQDNPQTPSQTTLLAPIGFLQAGMTILVESELELIQAVASGSTNDTCTVLRGHNGTTAASHVQGTTIYRVLVHPVISRAANRLVQYYFRQKDAADFGKLQLASPMFGVINLPMEIPADIVGDLLPLVSQRF